MKPNITTRHLCSSLLLVLSLAALAPETGADTYVGGSISGQTWTKDNSPYLVTNDIYLSSSLIIKEGVEVRFMSNWVFEVAGKLRVAGSAEAPVVFHPLSADVGWKGLLFRDAIAGSYFLHTIIEGSTSSGVRITNSPPAFTNCWIINNSTPGEGGGIKAEILTGEDFVLSECTVTNNQAADVGGGVRLEMKGGQVLAERCVFATNTAVYYGGGFQAFVKDTRLRFVDCTNINNHVTSSPGSSGGGGFYIQNRDGAAFELELLGCQIAGNEVRSYHTGGSQGRYYAYAAGIGIFGTGVATMRNCSVLDNTAAQYYCCGNESYVYGGGVALQDAKLTMLNCIVANNYTSATHWNAGGGICVYSGAMDIVNSTVVHTSGGSYGLYVNSGSCTVTNSIFYFNDYEIYPDNLKVGYSCVQGGYSGDGNIQKGPALCQDNFSLIDGSPCIDAGCPALEFRDGCVNSETCSQFARGTSHNDMGAFGGPGVCNWADLRPEPVIRINPDNVIAAVGREAQMGVIATGDEPLRYQWSREGTALPDQTNSVLKLPGVKLAQAGGFTVMVSNPLGSLTQSAQLMVSRLAVTAAGLDQGKPVLLIANGTAGLSCTIHATNAFTSGDAYDVTKWPKVTTINLVLSDTDTKWTDPLPLAPGENRIYGVVPVE